MAEKGRGEKFVSFSPINNRELRTKHSRHVAAPPLSVS